MSNKEIQGNGRLTKANKQFEGHTYRVVDGYPLSAAGEAICPRCAAGEDMQIGKASVTQYSYFVRDNVPLDKYSYYCECSGCNLEYVWTDEVKS